MVWRGGNRTLSTRTCSQGVAALRVAQLCVAWSRMIEIEVFFQNKTRAVSIDTNTNCMKNCSCDFLSWTQLIAQKFHPLFHDACRLPRFGWSCRCTHAICCASAALSAALWHAVLHLHPLSIAMPLCLAIAWYTGSDCGVPPAFCHGDRLDSRRKSVRILHRYCQACSVGLLHLS